MLRFSRLLLTAAAFALIACAAHTTKAAPVVYTSRTTFDVAVPSYTTITFDGQAVPYTNSLTYSGVTFAGATNYQVGVIEGTNVGAPGNYVLTSNTNAPGQFNVDNIIITPPANTTAFGFDIKSSNSALSGQTAAGSYQVTLNTADGNSITQVVTVPSYTSFSFIGFTSDVNITSIVIRSLSGGDPVLDNVSSNGTAPAATPEPATMLLFGTGLAGAASFARRRRRQQPTTD